MIKMFRELKGSYRYIILILALLFGQVICDLSLPAYTSDIIFNERDYELEDYKFRAVTVAKHKNQTLAYIMDVNNH